MNMDLHSKRIGKLEMLGLSVVSSLLVISVCLAINKNFFNSFHDAVNEYLPFFTQMGRIWSSGRFPFLTDNTLTGGNVLVEMSHCVFTPQSIVASLLAWHCEYKQVAAISLAFFNMTLMAASCLVIGNLYRLRPTYSFLLSAFCIIQPEFLFLHSRACYNSAIAQAWLLAAIATFLLLAHRVTLRNFLLNFFAVLFLLSTCYVFTALAYALFALLFIIFHAQKPLRATPLALLLLANVLALLFVLPLYSEYVSNSDLHNRFFKILNYSNNYVFPWSSEILTFLPTYIDYVYYWNTYFFWNIPFAFSTIFVPIIFFNRKIFPLYRTNREVKFFLSLILVYFICTQLPTYMGSMQYPDRFLPFFAFAVCLATSFILEYAERKESAFLRYTVFVLVCFLLSLSKALGQENLFIYLQVVSVFLLISVYFIDKKEFHISFFYPIFAFITLLILLSCIEFTKNHLPKVELARKIEFPGDFNHDGYIFTLGTDGQEKDKDLKRYVALYYARAGLYPNVRTINGYTPLGYKKWSALVGGATLTTQAPMERTLDAMLAPVAGADMCRARAWRVSTLVLPAEAAQKNRERLEKCGYSIGADRSAAPKAYASLRFEETRSWEKLPPISIPPLKGIVHESHDDTLDRLALPARDTPVQLVFPRQYWHGYRADLSGTKLDVTRDESGILTSVTVPAGPAATLELSFFPETWRFMWICPAFALLGLLAAGIYVRRRRPGGFWIPALPR